MKTSDKNARLRFTSIAVVILAIVMLMFPGVDGDGDITDKLVAVAMGIDYDGGALTVTVNSVLPVSGGESGSVTSVPVSQSGGSVAECLAGIEKKTGRSLELGLCGAVVIGDALAKEGVLSVASVLLSGAVVSPGVYLIQADGDSAENVIRESSAFAFDSPTALTQLIKNAEKSIGGCPVTLLKFVSDSCGKAKTATVPLLSVQKAPEPSGGEKEGGSEKYQPQAIYADAVYKGGVMAGILSAEASRGLSYYGNADIKGVLACTDFYIDGINVGTVSAETAGSDVKVDAFFDGDIPVARLKASLTIRSADRERINAVAAAHNLSEKQIDEAYKKNFGEIVKSDVEKAFSEAKALQCDVFEIEQKLYRFHTRDYKRFIKEGGSVTDECRVGISAEIKIA